MIKAEGCSLNKCFERVTNLIMLFKNGVRKKFPFEPCWLGKYRTTFFKILLLPEIFQSND